MNLERLLPHQAGSERLPTASGASKLKVHLRANVNRR